MNTTTRNQGDDRRALLDETIVRSISAVYAVGGDTQFCVPRLSVYKVVQDALGERTLRPDLIAEVRAVAMDMGAVEICVGNRKLFAAVREHAIPPAQARAETIAMKRRAIGRDKPGSNDGTGGKAVPSETADAWERLLASEGMPAEIAPIKRAKHSKGGSDAELDKAMGSINLVTTLSGVQRQPRTTTASMRASATEAVADLLGAMDEERQILRLKAEGLSLRVIGARLRMDKMAVSRAIKRIEARGAQAAAVVAGTEGGAE
jgi:hypothetical protein